MGAVRVLTLLVAGCLAFPALAQQLVAPTGPLTPDAQQKKFHLPPGFEIQLVAQEPDVHKPMNLKFDARGRLWVTHTLEYPLPAADPAKARDAITIFSDLGADGRAKKVQRFAEGLNIPIGVLPLSETEAIAWSIPNIYRLTDTNNDGVADAKSVVLGPFEYKDTHGDQNSFTRWLDGWIYANHGFSNNSAPRLRGEGQSPAMRMQSGHTYRFRADGSAAEIFSYGQVNPFGLSFDPRGNLFSADCHSRAVTMLLREGYYPSFSKPHDGLGFAPETTNLDHGGTGIAGVVYYAADAFPKEYRDVLFVGNVITNRIHCDRLKWTGSSPKVAKVENFLTCDDPWFRPVDIQLGPDGALYVADFYNKIIGHYEVPLTHPERDRERGRVWRIVYTGAGVDKPAPMPDLTTLDAPALAGLLRSANQAVRTLATNTLLDRFPARAAEAAGEAFAATGDAGEAAAFSRAHAIWVTARSNGLQEPLAKRLSADASPLVRVHLVKALGEAPGGAPAWYGPLLRQAAADADPLVRRAAAEAMAKHPAAENLPPLLKLIRETDKGDVQLIHAARIAARDQLRDPAVGAGLAALTLDPADRGTLLGVAAVTPTGPAALFIYNEAVRGNVSDDLLARAMPAASKVLDTSQGDAVVELLARRFSKDATRRIELLRVLFDGFQSRGLAPTPAMSAALTGLLRPAIAAGARRADRIRLAAACRLDALTDDIAAAGEDGDPAVRLAAGEALLTLRPGAATPPLIAVLADVNASVPQRQQAAQLLGRANGADARAALLANLRAAPQPVAVAIAAGVAGSKDGAAALLDDIRAGKASAALLREPTVLDRLRESTTPELDKQIADLTAKLSPADDRLAKLIAARRAGFLAASADAAKGKAVFAASVCAQCHKLGDGGGATGPALDGIGNRGLDRLLEDVLDPNRNVDQAFRVIVVRTKKGQTYAGFNAREEGATLVMNDTTGGKEVRVPLADIDRRQASALSPMPANVDQLMPEPDFYQLMAYLLSSRVK
jgi:putative heme-binding domain-containing protein